MTNWQAIPIRISRRDRALYWRRIVFAPGECVRLEIPRQLSGGMKMRVSIARALSGRPKVLLMDEPFAALDEMTCDRLNEELLCLRAENRWTALFVTHSVAEAVSLSDRIIVLSVYPGQIAHEIPIRFAAPRNADLRLCAEHEQMVLQVTHKLRSVVQPPITGSSKMKLLAKHRLTDSLSVVLIFCALCALRRLPRSMRCRLILKQYYQEVESTP